MAIQTMRFAEFRNGQIVVTMTYNDANNAVQSLTVDNHSTVTAHFKAWRIDNPAQFAEQDVPPGPPVTFSNLGGGIRFSPVELPEGDPRATNIAYSVSFSG